MIPRNERASVPPSLGSKRKTCVALMPIVLPVQPISVGGLTTCSVEAIVPGPDFQRKAVPDSNGPSSFADLTSGFQAGQSSIAAITENTVWESASICVSPAAVAGAERSISIARL